MQGDPGQTVGLWLRMLDTMEATSTASKEAMTEATRTLLVATERTTEAAEALSKATEAVARDGERREELVRMRMTLDALEGQVKELQEESRAAKVGKGDLLWKVLVGAFALIASGLGGTLLSIMLK